MKKNVFLQLNAPDLSYIKMFYSQIYRNRFSQCKKVGSNNNWLLKSYIMTQSVVTVTLHNPNGSCLYSIYFNGLYSLRKTASI